MTKRLPIVGLLVLLVTSTGLGPPLAALAQAPQISIEGQVVNATPGGAGVGAVTVALHRQGQDGVAVAVLETATDNRGRFRFDGVPYDPTLAYGITATYQEAIYVLDLNLSTGTSGPVTLEVYDSSEDDTALSASLASVLFAWADEAEQTVSTLEIVKIMNRSDRTFVPGSGVMSFLRFGLPDGAQGLQIDTALPGADFIQVDQGFALLASVPPGEHEVMYTYRFPYTGTDTEFTKSLRYGADLLRVLTPEETMDLSGGELGDTETVTIGDRRYRLIQATGFPKGAQVSVRLIELPETLGVQSAEAVATRPDEGLDRIRFEYAAPVALVVFMVSVMGFAVWRRTAERRETLAASAPPSQTQDEIQTIRSMIADLEKGLRDGSLTDNDYTRRRAVLDARLASLDGE